MNNDEAFTQFARICQSRLSADEQEQVIDATTSLVTNNRRRGTLSGLVVGFLAGAATTTLFLSFYT